MCGVPCINILWPKKREQKSHFVLSCQHITQNCIIPTSNKGRKPLHISSPSLLLTTAILPSLWVHVWLACLAVSGVQRWPFLTLNRLKTSTLGAIIERAVMVTAVRWCWSVWGRETKIINCFAMLFCCQPELKVLVTWRHYISGIRDLVTGYSFPIPWFDLIF